MSDESGTNSATPAVPPAAERESETLTGTLNAESVVAYLDANPNFLQDHPALLTSLNLPHDAGTASSLIERQVAVLRERNMQARRRMNELILAGKENDALFAKIRSLTLALLDVTDWLELNEIYATLLLVDFKADFVCCHLLRSAKRQPGRHDHIIGYDDELPAAKIQPATDPLCTPLRLRDIQELFPNQTFTGDDQFSAQGSAVLIPLNVHPGGYLAIGSRDANRFRPDQDTLFVSYISELVSHVTARLLL